MSALKHCARCGTLYEPAVKGAGRSWCRPCRLEYARQYNKTYQPKRAYRPKPRPVVLNGQARQLRRLVPNGYIRVRLPGHPLSDKGGSVYEHRRVLYDHLGPGTHPCHWCGRALCWDGKGDDQLAVDHLDFNKQNNLLANLVASCQVCNAVRIPARSASTSRAW